MSTPTIIPQSKATEFLTNPQRLFGESQRQILNLFSPQNIILFAVGLIVIILGGTLFGYLVLFIFHKLRTMIDRQGKKVQFLEICFDQYINYEDTKFLQVMDNFFKRLDQIIRNSNQIITFEIHKLIDEKSTKESIRFIVSCSNNQTIDILKSLLLAIDGVKINRLKIAELQKNRITEFCTVKKVVYKNTISPIYFKSNNIFKEVIQNLNSNQFQDAGCIIVLRSSNTKKQFLKQKRQAESRAKNSKRRDQYLQEEKSRLIIEKTNHGELIQGTIYVYGHNENQANTLSSSFASSSLNNEVKIKKVNKGEKINLNKRYLPPEYNLFRSLEGYSIFNSFELAHIIRPVYTRLQNQLNPNIITIPNIPDGDEGGNILLQLNNAGDMITEQEAFLNIIAFGDPNSGKSSGFIGNILKSYFGKNYGMFFTVFKSEEVPIIIELAKNQDRLSHLIVINRDSLWRTNIINTELKATGSIKNAITQFERINKIILNKPIDINGVDPFWENASKNLFTNLLKVTILQHGSFSLGIFEYISELASEYARAITSNPSQSQENDQKTSETQKEKQEIFENILKSLTKNTHEKSSSILRDLEEINKILTYFTIDWVNMPKKTRESVYTVFRSNLDALSSGFVAKYLLSDLDPSNPNYFELSDTRQGKIIILDLPVSKEKEEARIFQEIAKGFWQSEMIRNEEGLACVLVSDEFQQFGGESDVDFLSINRSYRIANIFATQNYTSLVDKLGETKTKKLLGNIQTKFFFQTSDKNTWQYARDIMGEVDTNSYTQNYNQIQSNSISSNQKFELLGQHFQQLGMSLSKHQAEAIVFKQGYLFKDNQKKYLNVIFNKVDQIKQIPQSKIQIKPSVEKYLSINEILARYPIGKTKLFKLIKDHNISTIKGIGGRGIAPTMVDVEELEEVFYKLNSSKLGTK